MRRLAFALLGLLGLPALMAAEEQIYDSAGVSSRWLNVPVSARVAALGGAFVARGQEPGGLDANPASLAGLPDWQLLLTHNAWVQGMAMERVVGAVHLGCWGTAALELDTLNLGTLERYTLDAFGQPQAEGTVGVGASALAASWAGVCGVFGLGATLRGEHEQLISEGLWYLDADLGADFALPQGWRGGLALRNIAVDAGVSHRPLNWKLGLGKTLAWERPLALDLGADFQPGDSEPPVWRMGAEWAAASAWVLRAGWVLGNERQLRGLSLGAGWLTRYGDIDYALVDSGETGLAHLVTLRLVPWREP